MPEEYYPTPGYYRILVDNPINPGPSTMFASNNGVGMQVTAAGSDEDDRLRQRWYVHLNPDGTGVKFFNEEPSATGTPGLAFENVDGINCVFLNHKSIDWTLKYVNESDPKNNDFNFYIYSSDKKHYLAIQGYGIVAKPTSPGIPKKNEYWHFIETRK